MCYYYNMSVRELYSPDWRTRPESASASRGDGLRWAEERAKAYRSGEQADVFAALELWQGWWRDVLLVAADCPAEVVHVDRRNELASVAARYPIADIHAFIVRLDNAARQLRENATRSSR
jgi:DNA polymerase III subunit delta'